jgi:hypothetical protein
MSNIRIGVSHGGMSGGSRPGTFPTVRVMATTMLTKRRAVDHCRMHSSLCHMP